MKTWTEQRYCDNCQSVQDVMVWVDDGVKYYLCLTCDLGTTEVLEVTDGL